MDLTIQQQPHRPGPFHQVNKPHKGARQGSRKSSSTSEIKSKCLSKPSADQTREHRFNQAQQIRKLKREKTIEEKRRLGSTSNPPLLVGLLDLHLNSCRSFVDGVRAFDDGSVLNTFDINKRLTYVLSHRLKMRFKLIELDSTKFDETLDIVKTLDILLLIHRPENVDDVEDCDTTQLLRTIRIHCLPTTIHVLYSQQVDKVKSMVEAKRILRSRIKDDKIVSVEKQQDYIQLFNVIGNCKRLKSYFKESRSVIDTDKVEIIDNTLTFSGFVRHRRLSPNDLIHVVGYDDYQIKQIDVLPDVVSLQPTSVDSSQVVESLFPDPMKQESLERENEIDPMEGEQTWPTAEELAAEAERLNTKKVVKRLPPGTSEYQGAWIVDDDDDDEPQQSEDDHEENNEEETDDKMQLYDIVEENSDVSDHEDSDENPASETGTNDDRKVTFMDVDNYDKDHSKEKESKILEKLREARQDEMFPDEIDTPSDIPARVRFARYRGLKSFRTSNWDPQENLPPDYSRIFQFKNFQQTKRRVTSDIPDIGVDPGLYVRIHLKDVPEDISSSIIDKKIPPALVKLLQYERKMTVMNFLIKRLPDSNLSHPIKSKDELIFYVGHRKFIGQPIFSIHGIAPKFKSERFLRDDVAMVATMFAPITFPPAPVLVFRQDRRGQRELVASGSVLDSNPNRLIIKRIRLSGHPFKIHSKSAVIRFMFFNSEDVLYFKPVELATRYNRRGHITEPLGTHGHMKCMFDKRIRSDDCVYMNLYKRVFPKWTYSPIYDV